LVLLSLVSPLSLLGFPSMDDLPVRPKLLTGHLFLCS
jgi:hypothetical protein